MAGHNGCGLSLKRRELDLKRATVPIDMHDRPDVSRLKPALGPAAVKTTRSSL
jgi:hypothetical protein